MFNTYDLQLSQRIAAAKDEAELAALDEESRTRSPDFHEYKKAIFDSRRAQLMNEGNAAKMGEAAKEYRTNLQGHTDQLAVAGQDKARRGLAQAMSGINTAANRRGLLYSGLRQGANAQAQGQYASGLSDARAQANEQGQQRAQALEDRTVDRGLEAQRSAMGHANRDYDTALRNRERDQAFRGSIFNSVGSVAGGLLARR